MLRRILLIAAILVTSQTVNAQEPEPFETVEECVSSCVEVLQLADEALMQQQSVIQFQGAQINNQIKLLDELQQEVDRKEKWYYNPLIVGLLGLVSGMALTR